MCCNPAGSSCRTNFRLGAIFLIRCRLGGHWICISHNHFGVIMAADRLKPIYHHFRGAPFMGQDEEKALRSSSGEKAPSTAGLIGTRGRQAIERGGREKDLQKAAGPSGLVSRSRRHSVPRGRRRSTPGLKTIQTQAPNGDASQGATRPSWTRPAF